MKRPPLTSLAVAFAAALTACSPRTAAAVEMADIAAPVVVRESPENESVIVKMADGALRILYTLQPSGDELRSITSSDGGLTWSDDRFEVAMPGKAVFCLQALVAEDGELHAFVLVRRGTGSRHGVDLFLDVWHWKTTGGGRAWSEGQRIHEGVVGALRGVTQLESGRILLPVGMWLKGRKPGLPTGVHEVSALYSDDNGDSWRMSSSRLVAPCYEGFNGSNYGACEPNVLEIDTDRVWMLMRTQTGRLYESHSNDGGATWQDARPSVFVSSDSPAEMMRLPDGRFLVLWHNQTNPARVSGMPVAGGREALSAAISSDNGRTWRGCREVYRDPLRDQTPPRRGDRGAAYPSGVVNTQGKVVLTTGQGEGRRGIVLFDADWLLDKRHEEHFTSGLDAWHAFTEFGDPEPPVFRDRTTGPVLIDHPAKPGAKALHLRRPAEVPGDGAVWNFPLASRGKLTLQLTLEPGFGGANIALADRLYNPGDSDGERLALFGLPIDSQGKLLGHGPLAFDRPCLLELRWNLEERECAVSVDGEKLLTLPLLNEPGLGVCYLRVRSTAQGADPAGALIERVLMEVQDD